MGKRANGEGSITQLSDGRYQARIMLDDGTRKAFYGHAREEVSAQLTEALDRRNKGLPVVADGKQTLGQYLKDWLAAIKGNVRQKTYQGYESYIRVHVQPALGKHRMAKLNPLHLQRFYSQKLEQGLSPTTVRHIHATLHRALDQAVRWGIVYRNVAELVDPPRRARHEMAALLPEQARALLDAAAGDRLEALYILAITTGMRQGELLGLRWAEVEMEEGILRVRAIVQRTKNGINFSEPKTAGSRRQIALVPAAVAALRAHRIKQAAERLKVGPSWQDNGLVFPTRTGRPMDASNLLHRSFDPLLKRTGLPHMRFHDLRHTAATIYLRKKVHVKVVSEMLGHSQIGITLNTYSHVLPDMQKEATAAMQAALWG